MVKDIYKVMSIKERFFSTMDGIDDCVTSWKGNSQVKTKHDREVNIVMGQIPDCDVPNPLLGKNRETR